MCAPSPRRPQRLAGRTRNSCAWHFRAPSTMRRPHCVQHLKQNMPPTVLTTAAPLHHNTACKSTHQQPPFGMHASCCTTVRGLFAFATPVFPKRYVHGHTALSSCAAMLGLLREGPELLDCTRTCACGCAGGRRWAPPHFIRTIACRVHIM